MHIPPVLPCQANRQHALQQAWQSGINNATCACVCVRVCRCALPIAAKENNNRGARSVRCTVRMCNALQKFMLHFFGLHFYYHHRVHCCRRCSCVFFVADAAYETNFLNIMRTGKRKKEMVGEEEGGQHCCCYMTKDYKQQQRQRSWRKK